MFKLVSKYKPSGDQPEAINELVQGIKEGKKEQVLLGATGTGKTFTIANVIEKINKPTLVLAHNKTLAGQLYNELKELFPENRVEYFVSYYDYYQPEAYVPSTDTYIEKDSSINDEIDELRHSATSALISRSDVIVVASVSCIYGIGEIEEYKKKMLTLNVGDTIDRDIILKKLIEMLYERNDIDLKRGTFRVRGDSLEIVPAYERTNGLLIEWFGDEIDRISEVDTITGHILKDKKTVSIFAASHFVTDEERLKISIERINKEKEERVKYFKENNKLIEDIDFKDHKIYIFGYDNCEVIIKNCTFSSNKGVSIVGTDGKCTIDNTNITIFPYLNITAKELIIKNMDSSKIGTINPKADILFAAKDKIEVIDSNIGNQKENIIITLRATNKLNLINSNIVGNKLECKSNEITTDKQSSLVAVDKIILQINNFNPININAPTIVLNKEEISNKSTEIKRVTDPLTKKRLELINILKQAKIQCESINSQKVLESEEELNSRPVSRILKI
jgi:hypothetical protein